MVNLWFFHSPKLGKLLAIESDVLFAYIIILEVRPEVLSYGPIDSADLAHAGGAGADLWVNYRTGDTQLVLCRREASKADPSVQNNVLLVTGQDIDNARIEFDNGLTLCQAINAATFIDLGPARQALSSFLLQKESAKVGDLVDIPGHDPALLRAAVARLLIEGVLCADLSQHLFSDATLLRRTAHPTQWSPSTPQKQSIASVLGENRPVLPVNVDRGASEIAVNCARARGRPRSIIPAELAGLQWPAPDEATLGVCLNQYLNRKTAVELYRQGATFSYIRVITKLSENEVRRLVTRCVERKIDGTFLGYYALIPGQRLKPYHRTKEIVPSDGLQSGLAGAWTAFLEKHDNIRDKIYEELLGRAPSHDGQEFSIDDSWTRVLSEIEKCGITEDEYPLSNGDKGKGAFLNHAKALIAANADAYQAIYGGDTVGKRWKMTGGVPQRLIRPIRPGSFAILDFHRHSQATKVSIENGYGKTLVKQLPRWYFSVLVEEMYSAILSCVATLEKTPSADSGLEALDCFIDPVRYRPNSYGSAHGEYAAFFAYEIVALLKGNSFCVLRLDNAWGNIADGFVRNAIYTFGCAVHFGPTYTWVSRNVVERANEELARRTKPDDQRNVAIPVDDLVNSFLNAAKGINLTATERLNYSSPVEALQTALADPASRPLRQPLPEVTRRAGKLLDHTIIATVHGNVTKGVRPYVQFCRRKYTNDLIRSHPELIGKQLLCHFKRFDLRNAVASIWDPQDRICLPGSDCKTEFLGAIRPDRWRDACISIRAYKLISTAGARLRSRDPNRYPERASPSSAKTRQGRAKHEKTDTDALREAKRLEDQRRHGAEQDAKHSSTDLPVDARSVSGNRFGSISSAPSDSSNPTNASDPFGLFSPRPLRGRRV